MVKIYSTIALWTLSMVATAAFADVESLPFWVSFAVFGTTSVIISSHQDKWLDDIERYENERE